MNAFVAQRISAAGRRGSSRPLVVETEAGPRLVKLRGAAQGTGPLVAEIIVAELAEMLGFDVPPRSLVELPASIETADWDDELAQLLAASVGVNLGFDFLQDARDVTAADIASIQPAVRSALLWLDRFVLNPDRTVRNPNLLWWSDRVWLIDHGASLRFQYSWHRVSEASAREPGQTRQPHLFESSAAGLESVDERMASRLTREVLESAVARVPDSFLRPLTGATADDATAGQNITRRRAAYVAFLWKRLKPPRPFLEEE